MALLASVMKGGDLYIVFASGIDVFGRKLLQSNGLVGTRASIGIPLNLQIGSAAQ
jgi:hypothetical protein